MCCDCERPLWTTIFIFCWLLLLTGTVLTHQGLSEIVPALQGLPSKFAEGTNEDLNFGELPGHLEAMLSQAEKALDTCKKSPSTCKGGGLVTVLPTGKDTTSQQTQIKEEAANAQEIIDHIAADKYIGSEAMRNQSVVLKRIIKHAEDVDPTDTCLNQVKHYCIIYVETQNVKQEDEKRQKGLEDVKNGMGMENFDTILKWLPLLNLYPYIMISSLGCYTYAWYNTNGVCFWVKGGTCGTSCCLCLHLMSCLFFTFITSMNFIFNMAATFLLDQIPMSNFEGNPSVETVIEHIMDKYPKFWETLTSDITGAWGMYLIASCLMEASAILIMIYASCVSWHRPYLKAEQEAESNLIEGPE